MEAKIYYNLLIDFFDDLKRQYINDSLVEVIYYSNKFEDAIEIKFISNNSKLYTFSLTLWTDKFNFPRVSLFIKHPNIEQYYEIIDEYNGGKDIDLKNLLLYISTILSNKFIFEFEFFNGKKIKTIYTYCILVNGQREIKSDIFVTKRFIFPWLQKKTTKQIYEFEPWHNKI